MGKYEPITLFLEGREETPIDLSFDAIEAVLGFDLPASASRFDEWWSNDSTSHSQSRAWLAAGYRVARIDRKARRVTFAKIPESGLQEPSADPGSIHPLVGYLEGLIGVSKGDDLTGPADPEWGKAAETRYGARRS